VHQDVDATQIGASEVSLYLSYVSVGLGRNTCNQLDDALLHLGVGEVFQVRYLDGSVEAGDHLLVRIEDEPHSPKPVVVARVILRYRVQADIVDE